MKRFQIFFLVAMFGFLVGCSDAASDTSPATGEEIEENMLTEEEEAGEGEGDGGGRQRRGDMDNF